ncbi:MAG: hypothetical protein DRP51_03030 [Candidatus Zixiibacteriota bacterium]|nr:MAG: hypothetical protein DRP51_03030 [candidate division Zixibacteria bacterium]
MRIIKRYKNRRLYDTELKSYITHTELSHIIKRGDPFKVVDSSTGEEITLAVLGQVLIGNLKKEGNKTRSRKKLIELINKGGRKSMSILRDTYLASVGIYNITKKKAEEIIDSLIKAGDISKSQKKEAVLELLDRAEKSAAKMKEKIVKESGNIQKNLQKDVGTVVSKFKLATQKDIDALNKKIDKLAKVIEKK